MKFLISKYTQGRSNRVHIRDPHSGRWTYGFESYDGLGYVYYSPFFRRYTFTGVVVFESNVECGSNLGGGGSGGWHGFPLSMRILEGMRFENRIVYDLEKVNPGYTIHHLRWSGELSHGSDIVISTKAQESETPFGTVVDGVCSIEVLGVQKRGKAQKPRLTFNGHKNFNVWRLELIEKNVLPVLAWTYDDECYYMVLTDDALYNGLYTNYGGTWHQQTGYIPVERLEPYIIDSKILFSSIEYHIKTNEIMETMKEARPILLGDMLMFSPGFSCRNRYQYDRCIANVREYGYKG